jgi:hypothetical protein
MLLLEGVTRLEICNNCLERLIRGYHPGRQDVEMIPDKQGSSALKASIIDSWLEPTTSFSRGLVLELFLAALFVR